METIKAILLGLVQGFTEFLPISSSGHLLLLEKMGVMEVSLFFNIMLHLGSLLSIFFVFHKRIFELVRHPINSDLRYLILATIPTGIVALLIKYYGSSLLNGDYLPVFFAITAVVLIFTNLCYTNKNSSLSVKNTLLTGFMQGIAVLPGISRSGITVSTLMMMGVDKEKALDFSFLLSIPIILLSVISELPINIQVTTDLLPLVCGVISSFLSGVVSLTLIYKLIKKSNFLYFGVYLIIIAVASFFYL